MVCLSSLSSPESSACCSSSSSFSLDEGELLAPLGLPLMVLRTRSKDLFLVLANFSGLSLLPPGFALLDAFLLEPILLRLLRSFSRSESWFSESEPAVFFFLVVPPLGELFFFDDESRSESEEALFMFSLRLV